VLHTLSHRETVKAHASDHELGPTIIAALDDGPLSGIGSKSVHPPCNTFLYRL
jgi:hypothetical protein